MSTVIRNEIKDSVWNTFYQVLHDTGIQIVPCHLDRTSQFFDVVELPPIAIYLTYKYSPDILNRIQVRRASRPVQQRDILGVQPLCRRSTRMYRCIVLHESELLRTMLMKKWHKMVLENLLIILWVHSTWGEGQPKNTRATECSPDHLRATAEVASAEDHRVLPQIAPVATKSVGTV